MKKVLLLGGILVGLSYAVFGSPQEVLLIKSPQSIHDLHPWLYLRTNEQSVKLIDVLNKLEVQHPHEFEVKVHNGSSEKLIFYLVLGNSVFVNWISVDSTIYTFPTENIGIEIESGRDLTFRFSLPELDRMTSSRLSPQLLSPKDMEQKEKGGKFIQPFFIGIFLFMVFFNLFYFIISGWKVYLKYAIYILLSIIFFSHYFGFLQLVFPWVAMISNNLIWILSSFIAASYIIFISDFGEFQKLNRNGYRIFRFGLFFKCIQIPIEVACWAIGFSFIETRGYLNTILIIEITIVLFGFYYLLTSKMLRARIIVAASFILFLSSMAGQLNPVAQIDGVIMIETGTLIEIMIFSISLALKAKETDRDKLLLAEQLLLQTNENVKFQEQVSANLERQVEERTISLEKRNRENEMLLAEIHHRVKNNLQIISSLINLKAQQTPTLETQEVLKQLNGRIFSMALVHEKLYNNENIEDIQLDEYLTEISKYLVSSFEEKSRPISLRVNCQNVKVNVEKALACGLITNELVTNAVKYAFASDQDDRQIRMSLFLNKNTVTLEIADNGSQNKEFPENFRKSFGSRFVEQLVNIKLAGEWEARIEHGFIATIVFTNC